jgi:hypothetical protein
VDELVVSSVVLLVFESEVVLEVWLEVWLEVSSEDELVFELGGSLEVSLVV